MMATPASAFRGAAGFNFKGLVPVRHTLLFKLMTDTHLSRYVRST